MIRNTVKTGILLAAIGGLFVLLGSMFGGSTGLIIGLVFGLAITGGSYWFSDKLAIRASGARLLEDHELPWLRQMVGDLATAAGMPMPKLYIAPSMQPNAFATGRNPNHAAVAVTQGILEVLDQQELRAVLAHELGHVRNRDILLTSIAASFGTAISALVQFLPFAAMSNDDDDSPSFLMVIVLSILAPLAAMIMQMALSRSREFEADRTGAALIHDGEPLARALLKIEAYAKQIPMNVDPSQASAYIINPLAGINFQKLFSTHPPTAERVARLRSQSHMGH
jgi:heat shock protein HtpX